MGCKEKGLKSCRISADTFRAKSHINPKLIRAVVAQLGGWDSFKQSAPDINNHGISGGYGGFVYYTDTVKFYRKNKPLIVDLAEQQACELGDDAVTMVQGFYCLVNRSNRTPDYTLNEVARALYGRYDDDLMIIYNALAWFAAEEIARSYCDLIEN